MLYKKKKQNFAPVMVVILLILLIGAIGLVVHMIQKYTPTKERMDPMAYYGIADIEELPLVFGTEVLAVKGRMMEGEPYVPLEAVTAYLNKRFYWDPNEQILIYTTPTEKMIITPENASYMVGEESRAAERVICRLVGDVLYIHIAFVKQVTDIDYTLLQELG